MFGFSLRSRSKLVREGLLLLHTDLAMVREGFNSMTEEEVDMVSTTYRSSHVEKTWWILKHKEQVFLFRKIHANL
jgi:hypothetical protein